MYSLVISSQLFYSIKSYNLNMPVKKVTKKPKKRTMDNSKLMHLPRDLTQRTPAQRAACIEFFMSLPLKELRNRQDLVKQQQEMAYNRYMAGRDVKNMELAMSNLSEMSNDLFEAIDRQQFPEMRQRILKQRTGGMVAYDVYYNGKNIDTVFFNKYADGGAPLTARYVKDSLVGHDGYPPNIVVRSA
jgi:hypothetical protein